MQLNLVERLTLRNQFEILARLGDDARPYAEWIEILERGHALLYREMFSEFDTDGVDPADAREVLDILDVFRALDEANKRGVMIPTSASGRDQFAGFDANTEPSHYAFARFVIEVQGRYAESSHSNAHRPTLSGYRELVRRWTDIGKAFPLDASQVSILLA